MRVTLAVATVCFSFAVVFGVAARSVSAVVPAASPTPTPKPAIQKVVVPALGRDGVFPEVRLSSQTAFQGGALLVSATSARGGTVSVFGRTTVLTPDASGGASGYVGFGTEDAPGTATLAITVTDSTGDTRTFARAVTVRKTQWTVDSFDIPPAGPPDPNAPPAPPPPPNDNLLLPGIYSSVSERRWIDGWRLPFNEPLLTACDGPPVRVACVSGYFGEERIVNGVPQVGHHGGTDFGAYAGTPVYASNAGVVVMSGLYLVRGNLVVVDHGGGVFSLYGHLSDRSVAVGDVVEKGELLGHVGSTGYSTGPHLHWEVSVGGILVDGLRWLDGSQGF